MIRRERGHARKTQATSDICVVYVCTFYVVTLCTPDAYQSRTRWCGIFSKESATTTFLLASSNSSARWVPNMRSRSIHTFQGRLCCGNSVPQSKSVLLLQMLPNPLYPLLAKKLRSGVTSGTACVQVSDKVQSPSDRASSSAPSVLRYRSVYFFASDQLRWRYFGAKIVGTAITSSSPAHSRWEDMRWLTLPTRLVNVLVSFYQTGSTVLVLLTILFKNI